ncbi:hypothetical protein C2W62_04475 [Candidatus Entotheonella serta]|nr:hypothetical protein C2W62_04475 [Candidatus Entotheonella serta]
MFAKMIKMITRTRPERGAAIIPAHHPFTYGVDLLKHALLGTSMTLMGTDFGVGLDVVVLLGFSGAATLVACLQFSHEAATGLLDFLRS